MLVIGVTGGIGSGKSTIAKLFLQKNITVVEADEIAHQLIEPGNPGYSAICQHFGSTILNSNKVIERKALREIIFKNPLEKKWLEELLHPLIRKEMIRQVEKSTSPYSVLVIPLLLETSKNPVVNRVLVIDTPIETQRLRTHLRDARPYEEIDAIITHQINRRDRLLMADDIIVNDGSLERLKTQVDHLHLFYLKLAKTQHTASKE